MRSVLSDELTIELIEQIDVCELVFSLLIELNLKEIIWLVDLNDDATSAFIRFNSHDRLSNERFLFSLARG